MIEQVNVTNFRCFQKLEVPNLKKVNLLVGQNSSGKSAFIEALFLSSSSAAANIAFQLRGLRRMGNALVRPADAQGYRGLWEDMFFDFNHEKRISIRITGSPNSDSRSLSVDYATPAHTQELPFGKEGSSSSIEVQQTTSMPQIEFKWKRTGHPEILARPRLTPTGLEIDGTSVGYFPAIWYSPGAGEAPDENAKRFSELDKRGDGSIGFVTAAIHKEFPNIIELCIEYHAGTPMMFATLANQQRKMPAALISDGVNRLLGICISLAYYAGGMVLIDQFEDGFHYSLLPSIWNSVYSLADRFKVQLFISTHSRECMLAMLPTMRGNEENFCLLQASRTDKGCTIKSLPGSYLESALEQDFEVR